MENTTENQTATTGEKKDFARKFSLKFGYQDKENAEVIHRDVVINRRPTGADFIKAMEETEGEEPDFTLAFMQPAISKFGGISMSVPITVLLSLNSRDREILTENFYGFLGETGGETEPKVLESGKAQLAFGVTRNGVKHDVLEFGKLLTGYDEINTRRETDSETERQMLTIGREIITFENGLTLEELKNLDWSDYVIVQEAEQAFRKSFRK